MSKFKVSLVALVALLIGILVAILTKWGCAPPPPPPPPDPPITMARFFNKTKRRIRIKAPPTQPDTVVTAVKVAAPPPTDLVWGDDEATIVDAPYFVEAHPGPGNIKVLEIAPPTSTGNTWKIEVVVEFEDIAGDEPEDLNLAVQIDPAADEDFRSGFKVIIKEFPGTEDGVAGIYYNAILIAPYTVGSGPDIFIETHDKTTFLPNP